MNYMWEALLHGDFCGVSRDEIRFIPAKGTNPYRELIPNYVNVKPNVNLPIEVNALYRYAQILESLIDASISGRVEFRSELFNMIAHFLSDLDLREGLCHTEYHAKFLRTCILEGLFSSKNAEAIGQFSTQQRRLVLTSLLKRYTAGTSTQLFAKLLRNLYPNSITYFDSYRKRELLIFIGKKRTEKLALQASLLCDIFVPIDYEVKMFWDMHFGLIGIDETMEIGQIMMY